jgi:hypothetical protein
VHNQSSIPFITSQSPTLSNGSVPYPLLINDLIQERKAFGQDPSLKIWCGRKVLLPPTIPQESRGHNRQSRQHTHALAQLSSPSYLILELIRPSLSPRSKDRPDPTPSSQPNPIDPRTIHTYVPDQCTSLGSTRRSRNATRISHYVQCCASHFWPQVPLALVCESRQHTEMKLVAPEWCKGLPVHPLYPDRGRRSTAPSAGAASACTGSRIRFPGEAGKKMISIDSVSASVESALRTRGMTFKVQIIFHFHSFSFSFIFHVFIIIHLILLL